MVPYLKFASTGQQTGAINFILQSISCHIFAIQIWLTFNRCCLDLIYTKTKLDREEIKLNLHLSLENLQKRIYCFENYFKRWPICEDRFRKRQVMPSRSPVRIGQNRDQRTTACGPWARARYHYKSQTFLIYLVSKKIHKQELTEQYATLFLMHLQTELESPKNFCIILPLDQIVSIRIIMCVWRLVFLLVFTRKEWMNRE